MTKDAALDWLLHSEQPSIRFFALTELAGRPLSDPEVRSARREIPTAGWAATILAEQLPDGAWVDGKSLYTPKYLSTNWKLLVLADLGITKDDPRIAKACALWIDRLSADDGGFGISKKSAHLCVNGNTARALLRFGYLDHPRVVSALEWLVEHQSHLGGWSCWGSGRNLDSWEGLSAFAAYPRRRWNAGMQRAVERGAEFFLSRELMKQGDPYEPWSRFHYPVHYYYDLLVGLDLLTALGYGGDARMRAAIEVLKKRRRKDGRWNLDAAHPDVAGGMLEFFEKHPKDRPTPWLLETVGQPSLMITLRARRVLARLDGTA